MPTIAVSKFKATCLAQLEQVRRTGQALLVTKRGVALAQVVPPPVAERSASAFGCMADLVHEIGDVVTPLPEKDWEVLR